GRSAARPERSFSGPHDDPRAAVHVARAHDERPRATTDGQFRGPCDPGRVKYTHLLVTFGGIRHTQDTRPVRPDRALDRPVEPAIFCLDPHPRAHAVAGLA